MVYIPMIKSYLENLSGFIRDEDKLVTYKWLSKEFQIHVNIAKIILSRYWEQKEKDEELVATYMLIGRLKNSEMRVEVVKDVDLEAAKSKFEKLSSVHIYSLQKSLANIDLLGATEAGDPEYSAIKLEKNNLLSDEELLQKRWGKSYTPGAPAAVPKKAPAAVPDRAKDKIIPEEKKKPSTAEIAMETPKNTAKKTSPPTGAGKGAEKKHGIPKKAGQSSAAGFGNLFKNVPPKAQSSVKADEKEENKTKETKEKRDSPKKEDKEDETEIVAVERKEDEEKSAAKEEKKKIDKNDRVTPPEKKNESKAKESAQKSPKKASKNVVSRPKKNEKNERGKKRDRSQGSENVKKKRKRIFVASDSSEGSDVGSEEDEEDSPPRRNKSPSPPPVAVERPLNKRKVGKMVDERVLDEDGCLVTKKVFVYESCSETEMEVEEVEPKKKEPEAAKKTAAAKASKQAESNVKKKQTSLLNFFKKA